MIEPKKINLIGKIIDMNTFLKYTGSTIVWKVSHIKKDTHKNNAAMKS